MWHFIGGYLYPEIKSVHAVYVCVWIVVLFLPKPFFVWLGSFAVTVNEVAFLTWLYLSHRNQQSVEKLQELVTNAVRTRYKCNHCYEHIY